MSCNCNDVFKHEATSKVVDWKQVNTDAKTDEKAYLNKALNTLKAFNDKFILHLDAKP